jgi:hypothetical protein
MCRENRRLLGDQRSEHQERRASARRGNETHLQWREFFPERVRSRTTVGLRPPLLAACADVIADTRFAPTGTLILPRGAHAPRSWLHDATLTAKSDIVDGHTHTHEERRASARRGNGVEAVDGQPQFTDRQSHSSRAAGVSPPWERNASAMARVFPASEYVRAPRLRTNGAYAPRSWLHDATLTAKSDIVDAHTHTHEERRASARRGNGVEAVEPWMVTFAHHGGLTPPAPGGSAGRTTA